MSFKLEYDLIGHIPKRRETADTCVQRSQKGYDSRETARAKFRVGRRNGNANSSPVAQPEPRSKKRNDFFDPGATNCQDILLDATATLPLP